MKNGISLTLAGGVFLFSILACNALNVDRNWDVGTVRGSGAMAEADREVNNVSGVELAMEGTLYVTMGDSESLRVEAEDNLLEYIQTDVRAGRLLIQTRPGVNLQSTRPIEYHLTVRKLDTIGISSSGDIQADDLKSPSFSVTISSSGDLSIASLECDSLRVQISSSGNLDILGGQARQQTVTISSSGEYRAGDLKSAEAEVTLSSSGTATIRVSDRLRGRLSSSGDIYYIGNPDVDVSTTSSGRARPTSE